MTSEKIQSTSFLPPGKMGMPFVGETASLIKNTQLFSQQRHQKYGSIFKTRIFGQPIIYVSGDEACRFVFENEDVYFQNKMLPNMEALLGKSSLTVQTGMQHESRRKILRKAFTYKYLQEKIDLIEQITEDYFCQWNELGTIDWYLELQNYTFDIACQLFMGLEHGSKSELGNLYKVWNQGLFSFSLLPLPWTKLGRALNSRQQILSCIDRILSERKKSNTNNKDVLSLLLNARDEDGNCLSDEEIKDQVLNLLSAGHGTLASALTSLCLVLGNNPEIAERCRYEQSTFDNLGGITFDVLNEMNYLEIVLQEVLRLMPPIGGGFREVIKDCSFNNYDFPKGWQVIYNLSITHKDSLHFSSPKTFNPERFNKANDRANLNAYFPFGGGKRRCLGENLARLEMKIFAALMLRKARWEILPQNLEIHQLPFPHPADNLKVNFTIV